MKDLFPLSSFIGQRHYLGLARVKLASYHIICHNNIGNLKIKGDVFPFSFLRCGKLKFISCQRLLSCERCCMDNYGICGYLRLRLLW